MIRILVAPILLFFSCSGNIIVEGERVIIDDSSLPVLQSVDIIKNQITNPPTLVEDILLVGNTIVVSAEDPRQSMMFLSVDDYSAQGTFEERRYIRPFLYKKSEEKMYAVSLYKGTGNRFDILNVEEKKTVGEVTGFRSSKFHTQPNRGTAIMENPDSSLCFVFLKYFMGKFEAKQMNSQLQEQVIYDYGEEFKNYDESVFRFFYLSYFVNTKKRVIVCAYRYFRRFDIIDMDKGTLKSVRIIPSMDIDLNKKVDNDDIIHYNGAIALDESFILYYIGHSPNEIKNNVQHMTYFEEYDYAGNPIARYCVDRVVSTTNSFSYGSYTPLFCVTPDRHILSWSKDSLDPLWSIDLSRSPDRSN